MRRFPGDLISISSLLMVAYGALLFPSGPLRLRRLELMMMSVAVPRRGDG